MKQRKILFETESVVLLRSSNRQFEKYSAGNARYAEVVSTVLGMVATNGLVVKIIQQRKVT
jgi:hypothetical protein